MQLYRKTHVLRLSDVLGVGLVVCWLPMVGCVQFENQGLGQRPGFDDQEDRAHDDHNSETEDIWHSSSGSVGVDTVHGSGDLPAGELTSGWAGSSGGIGELGGADDLTESDASSTANDTTSSESDAGGETGVLTDTSGDTHVEEGDESDSATADSGIVPGSLGKGELCAHAIECRSGHCVPVGVDPGTPASNIQFDQGVCSDCSENDDCQIGLCRRLGDDSSPASCELSDLGEHCRAHEDCDQALLCDQSTQDGDALGRCQHCLVDADCPSELYCDDADEFGIRDCRARWSKSLGSNCPVRDGIGLDAACVSRYCTVLPDNLDPLQASASCSECRTHSDCAEGESCTWQNNATPAFKLCTAG